MSARTTRYRSAAFALSAATLLAALTPRAAPAARDFSFIHMSDTHVDPYPTTAPASLAGAQSWATVRAIADMTTVAMKPFGTVAPRPSFALNTGDVTEFGFPGATGTVVDRYFGGLGMPVRLAMGNHDNTQVAAPDRWRRDYGGPNHAFTFQDCRFVALMSASFQDPNPSFGEETLQFLENEVTATGTTTPMFVYFHHPLDIGEFCSRHDTDRIVEALAPANVALLLDGHGHSAVRGKHAGYDRVMGGSTFMARSQRMNNAGFGLCHISGDTLRYAYKLAAADAATTRMMEKSISRGKAYPKIDVRVDPAGEVAMEVAGAEPDRGTASWSLDDESTGTLAPERTGTAFSGTFPRPSPGAHFVRCVFADAAGNKFQKSAEFYREPPESTSPRALWRRPLGSGSKCTPLLADGRLFLGDNSGVFRAFDAATGAPAWEVRTGGEILGGAAATSTGLVVFGSGDGKVRALNRGDGTPAWQFDTGAPCYTSITVSPDGAHVYAGNNRAEIVALEAATGHLAWRNRDAQYAIETPIVVGPGVLVAGAWDGWLYALDPATGTTRWKKPGAYNREIMRTQTSRYYAPADAPAVISPDGKRVFATDRGYLAGTWTLADGDAGTTVGADCAALTLAADGRHLYQRNTKKGLTKTTLDGTVVWTSPVVAGRIPQPPVEFGGAVYICTNAGALAKLDPATGAVIWTYRITPKLFVMAGVAVGPDSTVYAVGQDGVLTAVRDR